MLLKLCGEMLQVYDMNNSTITGNGIVHHAMYIVSVTPYIPGTDGEKNSLVGACELFGK